MQGKKIIHVRDTSMDNIIVLNKLSNKLYKILVKAYDLKKIIWPR